MAVVPVVVLADGSHGEHWRGPAGSLQARLNATSDNPEPDLLPDCCLIGVFGRLRPAGNLGEIQETAAGEGFLLVSAEGLEPSTP